MNEPGYVGTLASGSFRGQLDTLENALRECRLCPRSCGVDRTAGELGFCATGDKAVVAAAHPHFGEERPLVGQGGSGTIFFGSCNLRCVFCQNYEISRLLAGEAVSDQELGATMLDLQAAGCVNINLVSPSHVVPQIAAAVAWAGAGGLRLPIVYNTGGYDSVETLKLLEGVVDIYMPDIKFMDPQVSGELAQAPDYPSVVKAAVTEMHRQVGNLQVDSAGVAVKGLLVRHLVMPSGLAGTREVMRFLAREISTNTYVNIMNQYRACGEASRYPLLTRSVSREEYAAVVTTAHKEGITRLDERLTRSSGFP